MKTTKSYIFVALSAFLLIILVTASCRKDAWEYDENFIGVWHSESFGGPNNDMLEDYMVINGDSSYIAFNCETNCGGCNCTNKFDKKVVINRRGTKLIVGKYWNDGQRRLNIDEKPYLNSNGIWTCKIEGKVFHRE